jgi:UDP-N-acetylglucosamine 4,6-dehydratase
LFASLIAKDCEFLPITDVRMTRFWITLDYAVRFVLSSFKQMRGGEVFVPKIPSMRVLDLARALAPKLPHRVIGIRPGEKLHEMMISRDDARNTFDLGDRYVIEPATHDWDRARKSLGAEMGKPLAEGFEYTSDTNEHWLTSKELNTMAAKGMADAVMRAR